MKRLLIVLLILLIATPVFGDAQDVTVQTIMNSLYRVSADTYAYHGARTGSPIWHRYLTAPDPGGEPTSAASVSCRGYKNAFVICSADGTTGEGSGWVLTPYIGFGGDSLSTDSNAGGRFFGGTSRTISGDSIFKVEVGGSDFIYISCDGATDGAGTAPSLMLWIVPSN